MTLTYPSQALRALDLRHLAFGASGAVQVPWEEQPESSGYFLGSRTNEPQLWTQPKSGDEDPRREALDPRRGVSAGRRLS